MVGRRRGPLVVANPDSDSDSLSGRDDAHFNPSSSLPALSSIEPPAPLFGPAPHSIPSDNVSGSSRSSPAPDFTPPPTPGQLQPPVNLNTDFVGKIHQKDRSHVQQFEREADLYGIARAPHHIRKPSSDALQDFTQIQMSHSSASSTLTSPIPADAIEPRLIMASIDAENYKKVTITFARSGDAIRELIFAALQIPDEDQTGYEIHQDSECSPEETLSNELLFDICMRPCSGLPLQFLIKRRPQPQLRALPPPPIISPPIPLDRQPPPPIGTSLFSNHYPGKRSSPQSQHETSSSTSDRRGDFLSNFEGSGFDPASRHRRNNPLPRPPPAPPAQRPSVGIRFAKNSHTTPSVSLGSSRPLGSVHSASSSENGSGNLQRLPSVAPLQIDRIDRRGSATPTPPLYVTRSPPATRDGTNREGSYNREIPRGRDGVSSRDGTLNLPGSRSGHIRRGSDVEQSDQERLGRKERERERREKEKEQTQQMRSEQTKQWQLSQAHSYSTDTTSHSPIERLSPTTTWNHDLFDARRPGTSGASSNFSRTPSNDRPSTAQPLIRSPNNTSFYPPSSPSPYRPSTANLIPGSRQGNLGHSRSYQPPATATGVTNLGSQSNAVERGQQVPSGWMVDWRGHDLPVRALPPMKSFSDLRQQAANAPIRRRLPTPTSAISPRSMNNFGGVSDSTPPHSSPHYTPSTPLPYHDLPRNTLPTSPAMHSPRRNEFSIALNEQPRNGGISGNWKSDERPRSPPGTPGLFGGDRPDYIPPPSLPDPIPRNEFNSFGQAAERLAPHKLSKERLDRESSSVLRSPVDRTESTLKPDEHGYLLRLMGSDADADSESTLIGQGSGSPPSSSMTLKPPTTFVQGPPSPTQEEDDEEFLEDSDEESDDDGSDAANIFWQQPKRASKRLSKSLPPINTVTHTPKIIATNSKGAPLSPIPASPLTTTRSRPAQPLSPNHNSNLNPNRNSLFVKRDSITWAFRPPPEDMYERLEEFFPDHDLDKPVLDMAPSGGSSPIQTEATPPVLPSTATKMKYKKSIRAAARASKGNSAAQQMLRKRSTKLWGSRVEEVTPAQAKAVTLGVVESPSPSTKPIFKWVKGDLIGKGAYGRVYLAFNATAGEMIAVKQVELPKTISDQNDHRQMQVVDALIAESDTLKDLDHPNIVQYLGIEQSADHLSIFLEYVPGGSIGGCIRKHGKFDHDVVRSFASQMLAGLEYLHLRGVLHRDLKADNILLDPSGVCKISDFGISKRSDDNAAFTAMQGSIFWMAPEVMNNKGQGYNAKIDIWSLGCVVLEMWAGKRPWDQDNMYAVMFKLGAERATPPVPDDVILDGIEDDFRRKCFAIDPNERPTAAELRKHEFLELKPAHVLVKLMYLNGFTLRSQIVTIMEHNSQTTQAAIKIQRLWRNYRVKSLDTDARWQDAMERVKLQIVSESANKESNAPRSRWRRATMVATHIQDGHGIRNTKQRTSAKPSQFKILETQHWLELIDEKHRYGSNLKGYHRKWLSEDTTDNFFHWLDYGEGKNLSLRECPRERLELERISYLSEEQRLNYLVKIDGEGKLRWARNSQLVDTAAGKWKDLGDGMGIGPADLASPGEIELLSREPSPTTSSSILAQHYVAHKNRSRMERLILNNFTATGIMNKLLRKTVKRNTWIYVTDTDYNLFIGIKATGTFQHSSFLSGGLVTSAGLIAVEDGVIRKLSPLSGHYRTSIEHFKNMVKALNEQGAHLGKLDINKAEVVLWGMSRYAKVKKFRKLAPSPRQLWHAGRKSSDRRGRGSKLTFLEKRRNILYGRQ